MALLPTDKKGQQTVMIGLVGLILCFLFYYFWYSKKKTEITAITDDIVAMEDTKASLKTQLARFGSLGRTLGVFDQHMKRLEELIPHRQDVPKLLYDIAEEAQVANVKYDGIDPDVTEPVAYYSRETYKVTVLGRYHDIGAYLAAIASLPRIIKVMDVNITVDNDATAKQAPGLPPILKAVFTIETYVIPSPDEKSDSTAKAA